MNYYGVGVVVILCLFLSPIKGIPIDAKVESFLDVNMGKNRLLGMILAFNQYHIDPIVLIAYEYVSICEAGWHPTITIFTTVSWNATLIRYFRRKTYCYRLGKSIDIKIQKHEPSVGIGLASFHRAYVAQEINNYDIFLYHEDDIIFKFSHLIAYLYETKRLHELLQPENSYEDYVIGFQRYQTLPATNDLTHALTEEQIVNLESFDEEPTFTPICIKDQPYILVEGNTHQAIWIFTQTQLLTLQKKCSFFSQRNVKSREYMSSSSIYDTIKKNHVCAMKKVLPADHLFTFSILHYYRHRRQHLKSLFQTDENLRNGYKAYSTVASHNTTVPTCWNAFIQAHQAEIQQDRDFP